MKLAIAQIVLGVLILVIVGLAGGGVFSTHFSYPQPHGEPIEAIRPEALRVARLAAIAIIPMALAVIGCGIAQLRKRQR